MTTQIKIRALKYGNRLHYDWDTTLLEKTASHIFVLGEYGRKLHHHTKQREFTDPNEVILRAKKELVNLHNRIINKFFPFDGSLERFVSSIPNI